MVHWLIQHLTEVIYTQTHSTWKHLVYSIYHKESLVHKLTALLLNMNIFVFSNHKRVRSHQTHSSDTSTNCHLLELLMAQAATWIGSASKISAGCGSWQEYKIYCNENFVGLVDPCQTTVWYHGTSHTQLSWKAAAAAGVHISAYTCLLEWKELHNINVSVPQDQILAILVADLSKSCKDSVSFSLT